MITALILLTTAALARDIDPQSQRAHQVLGMEVELAQDIRDGLELLFLRRYSDARDHFAATEARHGAAGAGLGPTADLLVWQALMMENFDFRYDKQYWTSSKEARKRLEAALKVPGNEAWERFLLAGVSGIEAIHMMRTSRYLPALQTAFEAMDHIEHTRKLAPDFTDLALADGMYNYWRTVVTQTVSVLPNFGDHRAEGIEAMQKVERDGIFLAAPATLSLAFSWIEEGKRADARAACEKNRAAYPDNVINNLVLGSVLVGERRYDDAIAMFDAVLKTSENNRRARYWRGLALQRSGRLDAALAEFQTYLGFDSLETYQRAQALYRVGMIAYAQKRYTDAEAAWKASVKVDSSHKRSKERLDALKQQVKKGEISY